MQTVKKKNPLHEKLAIKEQFLAPGVLSTRFLLLFVWLYLNALFFVLVFIVKSMAWAGCVRIDHAIRRGNLSIIKTDWNSWWAFVVF